LLLGQFEDTELQASMQTPAPKEAFLGQSMGPAFFGCFVQWFPNQVAPTKEVHE
jgi:hypothetical protein